MNWIRIVSSGGFLLSLLLLRCLYLDGEYLKRLVTARCLRLFRFTLLYIADSDKFMLLCPSTELLLITHCLVCFGATPSHILILAILFGLYVV